MHMAFPSHIQRWQSRRSRTGGFRADFYAYATASIHVVLELLLPISEITGPEMCDKCITLPICQIPGLIYWALVLLPLPVHMAQGATSIRYLRHLMVGRLGVHLTAGILMRRW